MTDYVKQFNITEVMEELNRKYPSPHVDHNTSLDYLDYVPLDEPLLKNVLAFRQANGMRQRTDDTDWEYIAELLQDGEYQNRICEVCGISYGRLQSHLRVEPKLRHAYQVGLARRQRLIIEFADGHQEIVADTFEAAHLLHVTYRTINQRLRKRNQQIPKRGGQWAIKRLIEYQADGGMAYPGRPLPKGDYLNGSLDIARSATEN